MARILVTGFCAVPGPSRAGVQLRHVVRALAEHTVDLLVLRDGDQPYVERQGSGRLLRVPTHDADRRGQILAYQRALRRQLDGADYDVVHCRDAWAVAPVLEAREQFGYAVVFDLARGGGERDGLPPELAAQLDRDEDAAVLAADLVLVPSEVALRHAQGRGLPDRVRLSPPGVDVDRFDWDEAVRSGPTAMVHVGAIGPGRGIRTLLRAVAEVVKAVPARLIMVGPIAPGFESPLKAAIAELGLSGRVEVRPAIEHDQVPALLASAALCVVAAATELTPHAHALYPTRLLEYMACRRPVVAPRRGTVAMLIDHGREGLLFTPGDHLDLARKLRRLLDDPGLRDRLAANGYDRVRREFTASASRRAVRAAYAELAERPEWRHRFADATTGGGEAPGVVAAGDPIAVDDEFEATVYEVAPTASDGSGVVVIDPTIDPSDPALDRLGPPTATGRPRSASDDSASDLDAALATLDGDSRLDHPYTEERIIIVVDETQERSVDTIDAELAGVILDGGESGDDSGEAGDDSGEAGDDSGEAGDGASGEHPAVTPSGPARRRRDPWVVRHPGRRRHRHTLEDGTPIDTPAAPATGSLEAGTFVAGEIDVPTPAPELLEPAIDDDLFTAAAHLLGGKEPDTGA
ncbi:MAG: glycosyltransferase family 4 protein [Kofleriaceae bacterium]|jgi:glycosyltransferase involved in cell wall biosynthesis|nr:glycosyltransferase family 4 protein [Kofleriaceae bacterium]MBP9168530.1 glycosyltransferase family 4 protein [Kofleriaceae bacterium]MBP9859743.1 glycosyltransferase family 4 protein [Kofleriaceae bacterium]